MPTQSSPRLPERVVNKANSFDAAAQWDREQHVGMTPQERMRAARVLKMRAFPEGSPDIRACREA